MERWLHKVLSTNIRFVLQSNNVSCLDFVYKGLIKKYFSQIHSDQHCANHARKPFFFLTITLYVHV